MFRFYAFILTFIVLGLLADPPGSSCFAQSASNKSPITALYFFSRDCQPCQQIGPLLQQYHQNGWDIRAVEAPHQLEIARQFNIKNLPTLVLLRDGKEADRIVGAVSSQQLDERLNRLAAGSRPYPQIRLAPEVQKDSPQQPSMIVRGQSPTAVSPNASSNAVSAAAVSPNAMPVSPTAMPPSSATLQSAPPFSAMSSSSLSNGFPMLASRQELSPDQAIQRAYDATVRIKVEESNTTAYGTGTIVATHGQEALVLTCGHLFRDMLPGSHLKVDLFAGTPRQTTVLAQLIDFKADKEDIGLLSFRLPVSIEPVPILPIGESVEVGQRVFSIGCDHGNNPTQCDTRITHINRYLGPNNIETEGAPAVGRSGGGLFDLRGRLIGVCNAACNQENEGIFASANVLYEQLARIDHSHLFQGKTENHQTLIASNGQSKQPAALTSSPKSGDILWPDEPQSEQRHLENFQPEPIQSQQPRAQQSGSKEFPAVDGVQVICVVRAPGQADRLVTIDQAPAMLLSAIEQYSTAAISK